VDEGRFWAIVDEARPTAKGRGLFRRRSAAPDLQQHAENLTEKLAGLGPDEILEFDRIWNELHVRAYRWDLWGAAFVINGGCSDDCFDYFRDYLISLGREAYETGLRDPDSLADFVATENAAGYEDISYVAMTAWERVKGDEGMPRQGARQPSDPAGEAWDEEGVEALYPRLAERFWATR
jgi:hypothetical protein